MDGKGVAGTVCFQYEGSPLKAKIAPSTKAATLTFVQQIGIAPKS